MILYLICLLYGVTCFTITLHDMILDRHRAPGEDSVTLSVQCALAAAVVFHLPSLCCCIFSGNRCSLSLYHSITPSLYQRARAVWRLSRWIIAQQPPLSLC